jgi:drug/metabolite transporter (DMT)-like permease
VAQFCANFLFVYHAEHYLASGLVAAIYALLMVPNALLARVLLGTPLKGRFLAGSGVAMAGIALLVAKEEHGGVGREALMGLVLALGGLLSASLANVMQATDTGRRQAVVPLVAWAMLFGALVDGGGVGCGRAAGDGRPPALLGRGGLAGDCRFGHHLPALFRADPQHGAGARLFAGDRAGGGDGALHPV